MIPCLILHHTYILLQYPKKDNSNSSRELGGKTATKAITFVKNSLFKLKFYLYLYFMILDKYAKFEKDPSIYSRIIIWKQLGQGQTDRHLTFSKDITSSGRV